MRIWTGVEVDSANAWAIAHRPAPAYTAVEYSVGPMNLKRYNEFLIAIVGTGVPLVILSLIAWNLFPHGDRFKPPGVNVNAPSASTQKTQQRLAFCAPTVASGTDWQYMPVTSVLPRNTENASLGSYGSAYAVSYIRGDEPGPNALNTCDYVRDRQHSVIFNVLIRRSSTGEQHLLLQMPAVLISLNVPDPKCAAGEGNVPCGTLVWTLIDRDTNHDGVINFQDSHRLYVSDFAGQNFRPLSPEDATVLGWKWDGRAKELFVGVRRDANGDGQYADEDGAELLVANGEPLTPATPFIDATILTSLQTVLR